LGLNSPPIMEGVLFNYAWFAPFEITKKEILEIEVYNFEVENDNSYIVENTIVHNCQGLSIAGKRNQNDPRNSLFMEYVKYCDQDGKEGRKRKRGEEKLVRLQDAEETGDLFCKGKLTSY
jgi:hypothetical protein